MNTAIPILSNHKPVETTEIGSRNESAKLSKVWSEDELKERLQHDQLPKEIQSALKKALMQVGLQKAEYKIAMKFNFPNSSLENSDKSKVAKQVITPGYKIFLRDDKNVYQINFNKEGTQGVIFKFENSMKEVATA